MTALVKDEVFSYCRPVGKSALILSGASTVPGRPRLKDEYAWPELQNARHFATEIPQQRSLHIGTLTYIDPFVSSAQSIDTRHFHGIVQDTAASQRKGSVLIPIHTYRPRAAPACNSSSAFSVFGLSVRLVQK